MIKVETMLWLFTTVTGERKKKNTYKQIEPKEYISSIELERKGKKERKCGMEQSTLCVSSATSSSCTKTNRKRKKKKNVLKMKQSKTQKKKRMQ